MQINMPRLLILSWFIGAVFLLLYSFTQVDLSLTLARFSIWQTIQNLFQQIGYFNRTLSLILYLIVFGFLFLLYIFTLIQVRKKNINRKVLFSIIISISAVLFFSYNAFSYDLFNYIFDSKIFTFYFQNPYLHKALDFPEDPMLSFMHWTHRTYPYGPVWLGVTIPLSFLGFNIFLLTFYIFKFLTLASFIFSSLLIERIAKKVGINSLLAVALFSLNPLVIMETLVSSHNDIVMISFALFSVLLFLEGKKAKSLFWLVMSIGIKFATLFMIPAFLARKFLKIDNEKFFIFISVLLLVPVILASLRTNFQPWYLLFILPFSTFVYYKNYVLIPTVVISIVSILYYIPYIYLGNWDPPIPNILNLMMIGSIFISAILIIALRFVKTLNSK